MVLILPHHPYLVEGGGGGGDYPYYSSYYACLPIPITPPPSYHTPVIGASLPVEEGGGLLYHNHAHPSYLFISPHIIISPPHHLCTHSPPHHLTSHISSHLTFSHTCNQPRDRGRQGREGTVGSGGSGGSGIHPVCLPHLHTCTHGFPTTHTPASLPETRQAFLWQAPCLPPSPVSLGRGAPFHPLSPCMLLSLSGQWRGGWEEAGQNLIAT